MAVLAIKSEQKCKLCRHDKRAEIDALLELRSNRTRGEDGQLKYTLDVVLKTLAEWGVDNPTEENCKTHYRKHCEVVSAEVIEAETKAVEEAIQRVLDGEVIDPDQALDFVVAGAIAKAKERLARGENPFTPDHLLKAIDAKTRRSHNEAQREVLGALAGGIGKHLLGASQPKQISEAEVVDVELLLEEVEVEA